MENTAEFVCLRFTSVPLTHWPSASQTSFFGKEVVSSLYICIDGELKCQKTKPQKACSRIVCCGSCGTLRLPCLNVHITLLLTTGCSSLGYCCHFASDSMAKWDLILNEQMSI